MTDSVNEAAKSFGFEHPAIEVLQSGLIHNTYKVSSPGHVVVLQQINSHVFPQPEKVIRNYIRIYNHLEKKAGIKIPAPVKTIDDSYLFIDKNNRHWRATEFIKGSQVASGLIPVEQVFNTAYCFGDFARCISEMDPDSIEVIIPDFHNLHWRFEQYLSSLSQAKTFRLQNSKEIRDGIQNRKWLVDFYVDLQQNPDFRLRIMHHDCKISNILFDVNTKKPVCPIDLDTVMPGYYFSDIGDLIRSLAGTQDEASTEVASLQIRKPYYQAIISGYCKGAGNTFTESEMRFIHHSGLLMAYMQSLRFLTDYLSGDTYYKVTYPVQNLDRAINQFRLLEALEVFLRDELSSFSTF